MHQRHPIRVDKSRPLPAGNERHMTGSTQVSFHKIYRQKRCYSNFEKGKEGYSSSQWKYERGNSPRETNITPEARYSAGHSGFRSTRRTDFKETIKSGSPSSSFLSTGSTKIDREFPKRSFDGFSCNFTSGPEFDAPVAKKQKAELFRTSAPQQYGAPEFEHNKQKLSLDETKWMYRNQHAKMSGPYEVKQLMEGLQSRFLQEDLPIYQLYEGKLCKPITLKQLMDDVQQSMRDLGRRHSNQSMPSQCFLQAFAEEGGLNDDDLPPGFGGPSSQFSQKSSHDYSPSSMSSVPGPRCAAHGFSPFESDFGDADLCLPPGFEGGAAAQSQTSELCGTPRKFCTSVSVATRRDGVQVLHSDYEKLEPMVHDQVHSSWQGSSPRSLCYSRQGTKTGGDVSLNGYTAWAYAPGPANIPSFEPPLSQPIVCIGLPVSKSTPQSWPIASSLPSGVSKPEPYGHPYATTLVNNTSVTKQPTGFPERHGPDPLSLILSELLAAVKRTYVNSVLSALIGDQLDCWLDANKHWMGRSLSFDKDSPTGGCIMSSRTEVGMCSADASALHVETPLSAEASTLHVDASTANTSHPDVVSEARDAQGSAGSCLVSHAVPLGESQQCFLSETRNEASLYLGVEMADRLLLSSADKNDLGSSKMSPAGGKAENFSLGPDKVELCLSNDEACKSSLKSLGNETGQTLLVPKEEMQHKPGEKISHNDALNGRCQSLGNTTDAVLLEAKSSIRTTRSKKENMKSLKQLMRITSKLRLAHLKSSPLTKNGSKLLCSNSPEVQQRSGILASEHYDSCARTSVCASSWKKGPQDGGHPVECCQVKDQSSNSGENGMQTCAHSGQSRSAPLGSLGTAAKGSDAFKLVLSKVSKRRLKVARSKIHKWGVFSAEAVEAGEFVIEYFGELVRSRIADMREEHYAKSGIGCGYLFRIDNESAVDATKRGGLARFINHSCDPNCYIKIVTMEGSKRVLIFAKRHIQVGEEVTYDYKSMHGVPNFLCSCGSSNRC